MFSVILTKSIVNILWKQFEMDKYEVDWNSQQNEQQTVQRLHGIVIEWSGHQIHRA